MFPTVLFYKILTYCPNKTALLLDNVIKQYNQKDANTVYFYDFFRYINSSLKCINYRENCDENDYYILKAFTLNKYGYYEGIYIDKNFTFIYENYHILCDDCSHEAGKHR